MAGADASIYGMIKPTQQMQGPLDNFVQMAQVKSLMGQGELQDMQRRAAQRGFDEEEATAAAYREAGGDQTKVRDLLYGRGLHKPAQAIDKAIADRKKAEGDTKKGEIERFASAMKAMRDVVASATGDADMPLVREAAVRLYGPEVAAKMNIPQTFSPEWQKNIVMTGDEKLARLSPKLNMTDTGGQVQPTNPYTGSPVGNALPKTATPQGPQGATWDSERGVWVQPPARGAVAPGSATPAPAGLPPKASDVTSLRKEFNDLPEVKNYRSVVPIYNSAVEAPDTRAGDIQFAYTIGKIFDPNSVVREGELKLVGDAATVLEKYLGELRTLTQGKGRLTPETRAELLATAKARVDELDAAQQAVRKPYEDSAKSRNMPVNEIFADMPALKTKAAPKPAAGKPAAGGAKFLGFE